MRQIVTLVILAAVAFAGWKFWPQIKGVFQGEQGGQQAQAPANPQQPVNPPVSGQGAATSPGSTSPGTTAPTTTTDPPMPKTTAPVEPKEKEPAKVKTAPSVPDKVEPESIKVEIKLEMERDPATNKVIFFGTTNLPVDTGLRLTLIGRNGSGGGSNAMSVRDGSPHNLFSTMPFELTDTAYRVELSLERIRATRTKFLGPLVERSRDGVPHIHVEGSFFTKAIAKAKDRVAIALRRAK